jgi:hypothetical protein
MLSTFKSIHPYVIILIILTALIAWIPVFVRPDVYCYVGSFSGSPFDNFLEGLYSVPEFLKIVLGFLAWILLSFLLSIINSGNQVIEKRSYLPTLFFILSSAWVTGIQQINPALLGMFFVALGFMQFFSAFHKKKNLSALFNSGFLFALGSLFYLPFIILPVIIWTGLLIFRYTHWRYWLVSLAGYLTPWWLLYGIHFFRTGSVHDLNEMILSVFSYGGFEFSLEPGRLISLIFISVFALYSTFSLIIHLNQKMVRSKRYFYLLVWLFLVFVATYLFLQPEARLFLVTGIAFPVSFILANYFSFVKETWIAKSLFSVYLIGMILSMYIPLIF